MLVIISKPDFFQEEAGIINQLFEAGLTHFHLRKPESEATDCARLLKEIKPAFYEKISLHQHHQLAEEFGIKRLHFPEKQYQCKTENDWQELKTDGFLLTTSAHDVAHLQSISPAFDYVFFGPVYDSISKAGYKRRVAADFYPDKQNGVAVVAIGGILPGNIGQLQKMHFDGAALLGAIWQNPAAAVAVFRSANNSWAARAIGRLHFISNQTAEMSHLASIALALEAGCRWIQLRVKNEPVLKVFETARKAAALCQQYDARLVINDFPEIAREVHAFGLHLGLDDMPIRAARRIAGSEMIIGGTANTFEHVMQRVEEGADYVGLGPFRFTKTKEKLSPILGLEGYQEILQKMKMAGIAIPLIAIGGIQSGDVRALKTAGLHGVAMSGEITNAADPAAKITQILESLC